MAYDSKLCYFCGGSGGSEGDTILTSTRKGGMICNHCLNEAIEFWKHHHDLGLLE